MSVEAVLVAVGLTQVIIRILPSDPAKGKWSVTPFINRFMPFMPLLIATLTVIVKDHLVCNGATPMPWDDAVIKGMISGFAALFLEKTTQITIFGK
jgi:branched-subunit amino acid transport protein